MVILRIKQAQAALAAGRLNEAAELLGHAEARAHRQGQKLLGRLAAALLTRGREHLAAGRLEPALADWRTVEGLAGNTAEAAELKRLIDEQITHRRDRARKGRRALAAAERNAADGQLSLAAGQLAELGDASEAGELAEALDRKRRQARSDLARARQAAEGGDFLAAAEWLTKARTAHHSDDADALAADIRKGLTAQVTESLAAGHLGRAERLLTAETHLPGPGCDALAEAREVLRACRAARAHFRAGRLGRAKEQLRLAATLAANPRWVQEDLQRLSAAAEAMGALRGGPLFTLPGDSLPPAGEGDRPVATDGGQAAPPAPRRDARAASEPAAARRWLLQIDGAGAHQLMADDELTVGPISGEAPVDVGLLTDPSAGRITLTRSEGDYLLTAPAAVSVNGQATTRRLLSDGDTIALSPRCRLRFVRRHPASGSAALELLTGRLPDTDARDVLLIDRELVLGPDANAHVRLPAGSPRGTLLKRDGGLCLRNEGIAGSGADEIPISPGRAVRLGELGLLVKELT